VLDGCRINLFKIFSFYNKELTLVVKHPQFVNSLPWDMRVDVFYIFMLKSKGLILKKNTGCWNLMLENSGIILVSLLKQDRNHLFTLM